MKIKSDLEIQTQKQLGKKKVRMDTAHICAIVVCWKLER